MIGNSAGNMNRLNVSVLFIGLALAGTVAWWGFNSGSGVAVNSDVPVMPARVDIVQGATLYADNCAACHGVNLEGQSEWRSEGPDGTYPAPPHDETGHTWHHPDSMLFQYTKLGGQAVLDLQGVTFNSGMPAFEGSLTDQEIWNTLAYIQSTWPERARNAQAERTATDLGTGEK
mgnify:CR=1 FL=1